MSTRIYRDRMKHRSGPAERGSLPATPPRRISRRTVLQTGLGLAVASCGLGTFFGLERGFTHAAQATDNVVLQWNNAALQAIRDVNPGPTVASRAMAIMHTCMYDAWAPYDSLAVPTRPTGIPRQTMNNDAVTTSISYAAYCALMDLFPSEAAVFNSLMSNLGLNPTNTSSNTTTSAGIGNMAGQMGIAYRHTDGSNQLGDLNLKAYSDYTGYIPVNTPTTINDPSHWQPLLIPATGVVQKFLTPHWGQVIPFALTSGSQFRPASGPYLYGSGDYNNQAQDMLEFSASLNNKLKSIAHYWANGPHSETPPGHWALFAQSISRQYQYDTNTNIKLFFALANALFDAGIAAWDCKRAFDSVRPITAVRYLYSGQQVKAWGGIGQGTVSMDGGQWMPYQEAIVVTPSFPEYVSGHSTFSAAGAYILTQFTGSSSFNNSATVTAGSSSIEPGIAPTTDITLSWTAFTDAAAQAGLSRRYGGIHFARGDLDGRTLGSQVAAVVWNKAQSYINGTAS